MRSTRWIRTMMAACCLAGMGRVFAEETPIAADTSVPGRELRVPFDDLNVLLEGTTRRVSMDRAAFEALCAEATRDPVHRPPRAAGILAAEYRARLAEQRAVIRATLVIDVLDRGVHMLGLDLDGVGVQRAMLDDTRAPIGRADDGRLALFVRGIGRHTLTMDLVAPVATDSARQVLDIRVPTPAATDFSLVVPGDVEAESGGNTSATAVARRAFDAAREVTRFELIPRRDARVTLAMTLNSRLKRTDRLVVARSVIVSEVTRAREHLHASISLGVLHRAVEEFRFRIPPGFDVTNVSGAHLARWTVDTDPAAGPADGRATLVVTLREPTTDTVVLSLRARRAESGAGTDASLDAWSMPVFEPVDTAVHTALVGLLVEDRLRVRSIQDRGLTPVDVSVLAAALPPALRARSTESTRHDALRPIAAYYAPDVGASSVDAAFEFMPRRLHVKTNMLLTLSRTEHEVLGGFALAPIHERLFDVTFDAPPGWHVTHVTDESGAGLSFRQIDGATTDDPSTVIVRGLGGSSGIDPREPKTVSFVAVRTPPGWLEPWSTSDVSLPVFRVHDATRETGAVAVLAEDDIDLVTRDVDGLLALDEAEMERAGLGGVGAGIAFSFDQHPYAGVLRASRRAPRVTARAYSSITIAPETLAARYEVQYEITQASTREVSLLLPASTPEALSIIALDGVALKGQSFEMVEQPAMTRAPTRADANAAPVTIAARSMRRWTVVLAEPRRGSLRLIVVLQQPIDHVAVGTRPLPVVHADDVVYQSGVVTVEGDPELDIRIAGDARPIDVGELVDAHYGPGPNLLGVWEFLGDATDLAATVTRDPAYVLPPAIVQRAVLTSDVSASGTVVTQASFELKTKAVFLEIALPPTAQLWTITINGAPTKPQRLGTRLLIDLPVSAAGASRTVSIVYESEAGPMHLVDDVVLVPPALALAARGEAAALSIPVADLQWSISPPKGYRVLDAGGTAQADDVPAQPLAATVVGRWLINVLGGVSSTARASRSAVSGYAESQPPTATPVPAPTPMAPPGANTTVLHAEPFDPSESSDGDMTLAVQDRAAPSLNAAHEGFGQILTGQPRTGSASLLGANSLAIGLDPSGRAMVFRNLGADPRVIVRLGDASRIGFLAWAVGLVVIGLGLMRLRRSVAHKTRFVVGVAIIATVVAIVAGRGATGIVANAAFYAAAVLAAIYIVVDVGRWFVSAVQGIVAARRLADPFGAAASARTSATAMLLIALSLGVSSAHANDDAEHDPGPPVTVPDDVIIVPYDEDAALDAVETDQLLVPYEWYVRVWNLVHPEAPIGDTPPPAAYALGVGAFTATLPASGGASAFFQLTGSLDVEVFVDEPVLVRLPVVGAVVTRAELDGAPAKLSVMESTPDQRSSARRPPPAGFENPIMAHVQGRGRHRLELTLRAPITRRGGWRIVNMRVPLGAAAGLAVTVPEAGTDVRIDDVDDRRAYETMKPASTISTALGASGQLSMRWRPRVSRGETDLALRARSEAVLDVQEDGLALHVAVHLEFPRSQREEFSVRIPEGYLVERVHGINVRGWSVEPTSDVLAITTLKPADDRESFVMHLRRPGTLGEGIERFDVVVPEIVGASLQNGRLLIRRSPALDVRTTTARGASRINADATIAEQVGVGASDSPLGTRPYEAYRFASNSFALELVAGPTEPAISAQFQTILRIAQRERRVESRVSVTVRERPVYRILLRIPAELELESVTAPGMVQWAQGEAVDGRRSVTVIFHRGCMGETPISLKGRLGALGPVESVPLPRVVVPAAGRQSGWIAVQADPAYDVTATRLVQCENALLSGMHNWLQKDQRPLTRLGIRCHGAEFAGVIEVTPRAQEVSSRSVSMVRVTEVAFEDTMLLEFSVQKGGLREVVFRLPAFMRDARISVPLLRKRSIESIEGAPEWVRVRLELQDEVMDRLLVLVENDRAIVAGEIEVPIPVIETGVTSRRYAAIENAGRDEVVIAKHDDLQPLNRVQVEWRTVSGILDAGPTDAYVARGSGGAPQLRFRLSRREAVQTAGARIGLAETMLVVDAHGAYRAQQTYRMDNTTEQFLELELPIGADVWSVRVAGAAVKPVRVTPAAAAARVRIPLIKTAAGDLDYAVVVKYGGTMAAPGAVRAVDFPLVRSVNVNVELSQVRLLLPETRTWFGFGGSMRRAVEADAFEAGYLSYQTRKIEQLAETATEGNEYAQLRGAGNIDALEAHIGAYRRSMLNSGQAVEREIIAQQATLDETRRRIEAAQKRDATEQQDDGRMLLALVYSNQDHRRSKNVVQGLVDNFAATEETRGAARRAVVFDSAWLDANGLVPPESVDPKFMAEAMRKNDLYYKDARGRSGNKQERRRAYAALPPPEVSQQEIQLGMGSNAAAIAGQRRMKTQTLNGIGRAQRYAESLERQAGQIADDEAMLQFSKSRGGARRVIGDVAGDGAGGGVGGGGGGFGGGGSVFADAGVSSRTSGWQQNAAATIGRSAGFASLDFELPERGREYRFTTPRGEVTITARSVSRDRLIALLKLVAVVSAALVLALLGRLLRRLPASIAYRLPTLMLSLGGGMIMILLGILPLLGLIVMMAGVVAFVIGRLRPTPALA